MATETDILPARGARGPKPRTPRRSTDRRALAGRVALYLGALAVLATGADHLEQYYVDQFSTIPTIGTLFLLNFVSSVVVAIVLTAPIRRVAGRWTAAVRALAAVAGIGLALSSLAGLFISESVGLFGFMDHGYRLTIIEAITAEAAATVFLAAFLAIQVPGPRRRAGRGRIESDRSADRASGTVA